MPTATVTTVQKACLVAQVNVLAAQTAAGARKGFHGQGNAAILAR